MSSPILAVVCIAELHHAILCFLGIPSLRNYGLTSKDNYTVVKPYLARLLDVDRLLNDFIPSQDIARFRAGLRLTDAIIGGSVALQFLTGIPFRDSDLDIYVGMSRAKNLCGMLISMGAKPIRRRNCNPEDVTGSMTCVMNALDTIYIEDDDIPHSNYYTLKATNLNSGIFTVLNFAAQSGRLIQVIITTGDPISVVASYHSTTVMNFLTATHAFCYYPIETLECFAALYVTREPKRLADAVAKYSKKRGWREVHTIDEAKSQGLFPAQERHVGDEQTCIVRLSPGLAPVALAERRLNLSWKLGYDTLTGHASITGTGIPSVKRVLCTWYP